MPATSPRQQNLKRCTPPTRNLRLPHLTCDVIRTIFESTPTSAQERPQHPVQDNPCTEYAAPGQAVAY